MGGKRERNQTLHGRHSISHPHATQRPQRGEGGMDAGTPHDAILRGIYINVLLTLKKNPSYKNSFLSQMSSLCGVFSRDEMRAREGNSRVLEKIKEKNKQPDKVIFYAFARDSEHLMLKFHFMYDQDLYELNCS